MSAEQYGTRAERRAQRRSRTPKVAAAAVVGVLALGGLGTYLVTRGGEDENNPTGGQAACAASQIPVAVDPSLSPTLTKALTGFTGGKDADGCARSYSVMSISDDELVKQISNGSPAAQIWITDSPQTLAKASRAAKTTITPRAPFASTPVVISAPSAQLDALGTPTSSWQKIVRANPALTVADPTKDRAGALAVTRAGAALGNGSDAQAALGRLAASARSTIPADAPHVTTEAALIRWNRDHGGKLAETGLQDGSPLVTLAAAPLVTGDAQTDAALAELNTHLTKGTGRTALAEAGYRTPDGKSAPTTAPDGARSLRTGATPPARSVDATLAMWQAATKPLRLTTVVDVSGSMSEQVNGASRIDVVSQTAVKALDSVPATTSIGLWEFSTARRGTQDYTQLVPMGPVSDPAQHAKLERAAKALPQDLRGDTGLYDTLWATFQAAQKDHRSGQVSTVAIITDGRNDDTTGGLTLAQLTAKIRASVSKDKPVDISPIAIGDDVDLDALREIATLTGGKVYTAKTPRDIPAVLTASLLDRS